MADFTIPILGFGTVPDSSGDVFFEPLSIKASSSGVDPLVLIFNNSGVKDGVRGSFIVPENYASGGTTQFRILWTADDGTTNSCQFDLSYSTFASDDLVNAAAENTADTVAATKIATALDLNVANIDVTEGNFTAGDLVVFELFRDSPTDSLAADVIVFAVLFKYDDV